MNDKNKSNLQSIHLGGTEEERDFLDTELSWMTEKVKDASDRFIASMQEAIEQLTEQLNRQHSEMSIEKKQSIIDSCIQTFIVTSSANSMIVYEMTPESRASIMNSTLSNMSQAFQILLEEEKITYGGIVH